MLTHENVPKLNCNICGKQFTRADNLAVHIRSHENPQYSCQECGEKFATKYNLMQHIRTQHSNDSPLISVKKRRTTSTSKKPRKITQALDVFKTVYIEPEEEMKFDITCFYNSVREELIERIEEAIEEKDTIKWHLLIKVILEKTSIEGDEEIMSTYFHTDTYVEFTIDNVYMHLDEGHQKIIKSFEKFLENGSGWTLKEICYFELKLAKNNPLMGSSYMPLPNDLKEKKAILNIQNFEDNKCFLWCLLAHKQNLDRKENPERVSKYEPFETDIAMGNVPFPVPYRRIPVLEDLNNLRINVYGYEEGEIYILHVSQREDEDVINLLLIGDGENNHYCLIRDFSRFMGDRTKHNGKQHYCFRCLHSFITEAILNNHLPYCKKQAAQVIKMPKETESFLSFTGTHLQHPVPFVIYADFECLLMPIDTCRQAQVSSYQANVSHHVACGYAYVIVGSDGRRIKPISVYRGDDAVEHFLDEMIKEKETLGEKLKQIVPMKLTSEQEEQFKISTICSICKKALGEKRVRDHNHVTGVYRGAAHPFCNLNFKQSKVIPIVFHNLKNYDAHLIMQKLGKYTDHKIDVIANTLEKYITFKIKKFNENIQMVFLDSYQFLSASLDKLTQNLQRDQFKILKEHFPNEEITLLTRKGVYPYEYFTNMEKFDEIQLPPKSAFYSSLNNENISDEDYNHAQRIWESFRCQTLGDYHDLYVKTDVLLLADIFQNFRGLCKQYYDIDPLHLVTSPGLSWQACLKMTEVELELFTDVDMMLFIEQGVRGGVSQISHRFATANNLQVPNYKPNEATSHIMYWDANNLYGWAMSQYMPYGGFQWANPKEFSEEKILNLKDEANIGYIFEVDLEYPEFLHDIHNDYPLAPERITVQEDMLSSYAKSLLTRKFKGTPKLIPNLLPKERYITHYRNLKLYIQLGMKLGEIHKVLEFNQSPWLKKYIGFNTEKRKSAKSSFEKDFFKLLNNSIYGKCIENLRKRRNIEICNDTRRAQKLVSSPNFKSFKEFNENLVAVERKRQSILMNRPIYVGFSILELSKVLMYDFHYNFIKKLYGNRALLLFTDTDSLTYHITTENLQKEMQDNAEKFDFSDYPEDHPLFSNANKKVLGKFKDELNGDTAYQFAGLKAKMYSIKSAKEEKKRAKGISTRIVRNKLNHQDYVNSIINRKITFEVQKRIAQQSHQLYTIEQKKKMPKSIRRQAIFITRRDKQFSLWTQENKIL